jgi:DNA-binding transcriptional regulator YhcF (GntR family)
VTDNAARSVQVDYESGEKLYLQIARIIRDRIISGELPMGAQIPSGNQMKQEWGVNRLTGAQAVEELRKAGLVVTRPGVGTFVSATPVSQVVGLRPGDRVISRMPTEEERERLSTGYLTPVLVVTRSDGRVEAYNAAVTVCSSERLTGHGIESRRRLVESRHGRVPVAVLSGADRRPGGARGRRGLAVQVVHVVLAA